MAHHVEPMDIDSDFDNKENSLHHNNVLPFTEKGYEELDVSELNMKLRYSITPASSPMSKSYTANYVDNRSLESVEDSANVTVNENSNLTRSLNSTLTKNDNVLKSLKALPLQNLSSEQLVDNTRNTSVHRPFASTVSQDANITVTVSGPNDIDENLSLPSSSSSAVQTPEATTPTKDFLKSDGGSPIMRGLKSVLNMFRSSQSPIPPTETEDNLKPELLSPAQPPSTTEEVKLQAMLASTPISTHQKKEVSPTKRNSPHKDSLVFNEDLEKELQWKDETTILFSQERIPIHKLFFQQPQTGNMNTYKDVDLPKPEIQDDLNSTVEYMDISYNDSMRDRTMTDVQVMGNRSECTIAGESDGEFVDCETTFTKNESLIEDKDKTPVIDNTLDLALTDIETVNKNTSAIRLKQIILNTTQDILDATLSITPEDLLSDALETSKIPENTVINSINELEPQINDTITSVVNQDISLTQLTSQTDIPDSTNVAPVVEQDLNITKVIENDIHTIEEFKNDPNVTNNTENVTLDKQDVIVENPDSISSIETLVQNDKIIEQCDLIQDTKDFEHNTTAEEQNINEENSLKTTEQSVLLDISSSGALKYAVENLAPIPNMEVDVGLNNEVLITQLPVDIPLPDEDDLDKELNVPLDIATDESSDPVSLPLDLVDDINVKSEIPEIVHEIPLEGTELNLKENEKCTHSPRIFESGDNIQNLTESFHPKVTEVVEKVVDNADVNNPKEEPQIETVADVLPETVTYLNVEDSETQNKIDQVHANIEAINITEIFIESVSVNTSLTGNVENNISQIAVVPPININESVIDLKPLPDIINQTITNVPETVPQEQSVPLSENSENTTAEVCPYEKVLEAMHNIVPELLSDTNNTEIVSPASKEADQSKEISFTPIVEETIKHPVTHVTETLTAENSPVVTELITNAEKNRADINPMDVLISENENSDPLNAEKNTIIENNDLINEDEEITLSENNSPFVSVIAEDIPAFNSEEIGDVQSLDDKFASTGKVVYTPPASPPITSKGYNFNFDEMDNPFATKTKIRLSPPLGTPTKAVEPDAISKSSEKPITKKEINNRRKSQPERKRPVASKRKFNSSFTDASCEKTAEKPVDKFAGGDINLDPPTNIALDPKNVTIEENKIIHEAEIVPKNSAEEEIKLEDKIEHPITKVIDTAISESTKTLSNANTSSSEQSTYYSAGTSSSESFPSRNVFNLPEIDDMNFNPFATKSKMRDSPPPSLDTENSFATKSIIRNSPESSMIIPENDKDITKTVASDDKIESELMEKDSSGNLSNTTNSSKLTDERNDTVREANTEDEDTIEGPFLEADDLNTDNKMADFDSENIDMMQFSDLPAQETEENLDNGELFIDAEAFEFLLNQNKCNTVVDSGKESLFLKFDPLFAKRMSSVTSDGVVASLRNIQNRQSTPTKAATSLQKEVISTVAGPSNMNVTQDMNVSEEFNDDNVDVTISKPMMVVPPAVNPVTPRNKSLTPNRSNRRSITFTSPAMAVIDRLLSLSGNNSLVHDTTVTHAIREQNEADIALTQLRELLAEKEIHVYSLRSESQELKDRLSSLESHLKSLETESQDRLKKINDLNDRLAEKTKINKNMAAVVEEYERTIASLISETAQDKKRHAEERIKLINERDEQTAHLASMEVSFSDLHSKYEKSKQVILNCKANEDAYKKSMKDFEENLTKMQNNYELLKQHATSKLNHANQELEKMNKTHEAEVLKLNAMIKRKDLHITSLEESLAQKTKANEELTAICDELINKVG